MRFFIEIIQCIYQRFNIVAVINGHDLVALFIIGCMKRKRQFELYLIISQLSDHFRHAGRGYCYPPGTHSQSIGRGYTLNGFQHVFVIEQGLTHAHKNNIAEFFIKGFFRLLINEYYLIVNLVKMQVAFSIHVPGSTEFTTQAAANLR